MRHGLHDGNLQLWYDQPGWHDGARAVDERSSGACAGSRAEHMIWQVEVCVQQGQCSAGAPDAVLLAGELIALQARQAIGGSRLHDGRRKPPESTTRGKGL
jgi:hypothetical protein